MKKIVLAMLLVAAVTAVAQTASQPNSAPAQSAPQPGAAPAATAAPPAAAAPAQQKKEIKDPAEYNAYVGAVEQKDPAAKISGLEAFITQYPNSVMKEESLEYLMIAYQQTSNSPKMLETAQKVLAVNPCNIRALALVAYSKQAMATAGQNAQQNFADAGQAGQKGLQCLQTAVRPYDTTPADWDKLKTQTSGIFNGAAGISAYQAKDYANAEQYLRAAVQGDQTNLLEIYDLALADLAPGTAENDPEGLFYIARASNLAQGAGRDQIAKFGKSRYVKYHGADDGWSDLLTQTTSATQPPANFAITKYVPPTLAEQAAALVKSKKVEEMSFAEWQLVLSEGTPEDADKVWTVIKGKPLQLQAHIISIESSSKHRRQACGHRSDHDGRDSEERCAEGGHGFSVRRNAGLLRCQAVCDDDGPRGVAGEGEAEADHYPSQGGAVMSV
jgi:hypothetical protein